MTGSLPEEAVAAAFVEQRGRLVAVAYRMLGSQADAEDAVQEAWLRLACQNAAAIDNFGGRLTPLVGRICIDMLRSRKTKPEVSYDDRLPELEVTEDDGGGPEDEVLLADSIGLALFVVLVPCAPPSGWHSCCTTCSRCRSRRSVRSSADPRTRRRCSPAGPAGRCRARIVPPMNGSSSARWSMRFSRNAGRRLRRAVAGARPGRGLRAPTPRVRGRQDRSDRGGHYGAAWARARTTAQRVLVNVSRGLWRGARRAGRWA